MKHQDYIYLSEDYYNKPKEMFFYLLNLIKANSANTPPSLSIMQVIRYRMQ
ncbi:Uncharacterised protein [Campylobacter hyointestinalis]|uniref:hypothetical protein n=1 Tax=Campylobacter hyointestinalis TaxID=198 RepID=UPI00072AB9B2|nr:hypothetical protein [Campylobacter hyointestinalis]CUU68998.1 Uncharacterised protein [Campylobacter hyointestinalis]